MPAKAASATVAASSTAAPSVSPASSAASATPAIIPPATSAAAPHAIPTRDADIGPIEEEPELELPGEEEEEQQEVADLDRELDYGLQSERYILHKSKMIDVSTCVFDLKGTLGQIRSLSDSLVAERVAAMRGNLPEVNPRVLLWMMRAGDEKYVVLGGQHTVRACQLLVEEYNAHGEVPPPAICSVQATIVAPTTPLDVRQRMAGNHQLEQTTVRSVAFSRLVGLIHTALTRDMYTDDYALLSAVQKRASQGPPSCEPSETCT